MLSVCIYVCTHKCTHTHIFIVDQWKERRQKSQRAECYSTHHEHCFLAKGPLKESQFSGLYSFSSSYLFYKFPSPFLQQAFLSFPPQHAPNHSNAITVSFTPTTRESQKGIFFIKYLYSYLNYI